MKRSTLGRRLNQLGVAQWYKLAAGEFYALDPWASFELASAAVSSTSGYLRNILDLFVLHVPVAEQVVRKALGASSTSWLQDKGVLVEKGGALSCELCLIVAFDEFLFADWPVETRSHHLASQKTYLSKGSYDCARFAIDNSTSGAALDLGSGTGLVTVVLAKRAEYVTAVDVEHRAHWLTQINCLINGKKASVMQESWRRLSHNRKFDLIVSNPPWRIVPPDVTYPDPIARVGTGTVGLGKVIEILELLPALLSRGGTAAIRFDLPVDRKGRCPYLSTLDAILGRAMEWQFVRLGTVAAEEQARISADSCAHLNRNIGNLTKRFRDHYVDLGISSLRQIMCVVHRK